MGDANTRQVAGNHYKNSSGECPSCGEQLQHWDLVAMMDLDYFQGQITKYLIRWRLKNGVQDLLKARHFLDKYIEVALGSAEGRELKPGEQIQSAEAPDFYEIADEMRETIAKINAISGRLASTLEQFEKSGMIE